MKTIRLMFLLIFITISAACGPAAQTETPATPVQSDDQGALDTVTEPAPQETDETAVPTAPPLPSEPVEAYPAQPTAVPLPDNYPAPQPVATANPYPEAVDGFIWMLLPVGTQCQEDASPYADLQDAIAGLTAINVQTGQAEVIELTVCAECGCPTSAHYHVQISVENVNAAQTLGWQRE